MTQAPSWRTKLITNHPNLLHPPEGQPEAAAGYISCEEGWSDLLARLCVRMEAALQQGETIRVLQIKKKFATLRVYWRGDVTPETATRLHEAVALAKARSACTCEACGAEGRLYNRGEAYVTRCATHANGELVPVPAGQENVHLVRAPMPDGYRVVARRYDREADRFVDGDPEVLESKRPETFVTENWLADLRQAHPRLFGVLWGWPKPSLGYTECSEGWRDVLEQLCTRIEAALAQNETFKFVRIGQRLSFLWIEWDGEVSDDTRARIEEAIRLASVRADRTCRTCGLEEPRRA